MCTWEFVYVINHIFKDCGKLFDFDRNVFAIG